MPEWFVAKTHFEACFRYMKSCVKGWCKGGLWLRHTLKLVLDKGHSSRRADNEGRL